MIKVRRVFVTGMPGGSQRETTAALAKHFNWNFVHVGDLCEKEISKKTERGKAIQAAQQNFKLGKFK